MAYADLAKKDIPSIQEVIQGIGFGHGQVVAIVVACGTFFAEGLELFLVSLMSGSIVKDIGPEDGSLHSIFLIAAIVAGAFFGNLLSGPFADLAGRQHPIIIGYSLVVIFSVVSSFMNSVFSLSAYRFFVGLGFGLGQPAAIALVNELVPKGWSFVVTCSAYLFFGFGAALAVLLVMLDHAWLQTFTMTEWRLLLRCAAAPVGFFGLAAIFALPESPSYLAATGDFALARDVLANLRRLNGLPPRKLEAFYGSEDQQQQLASPWVSTFSRLCQFSMLPQTIVLCLTTLVLHFALYGTGFVGPLVLVEVLPTGGSSLAPTSMLLLVFAFAGALLVACMTWGSFVAPKLGVISSVAVAFCSALLFSWTTDITHPASLLKRLALIPTCIGLCSGPTFGILFLVQFSAVYYPTLASATGVAACLAVGRLGAFAAPLAFGAIQAATGSWQPFFHVMAMLELGCLLVLMLLRGSLPECREIRRPLPLSSSCA